ncbi:uncharacterized protein LOC135689104 [Rhopilema esculentum]|uniref:uncharacterized protein LOC135689104 n=1 Tax=Rhopilema esculentum TaxID=499914 RepID=UPI0031DFD2A7
MHYPKFKLGDEIVRKVPVPATYSYVEEIQKVVFGMPEFEMEKIIKEAEAKMPSSLTSMFENRISKEKALEKARQRQTLTTLPYPSVHDQEQIEIEESKRQETEAAAKQFGEKKQATVKHVANQ